ncbi:hypothetical protein CS022_08110 [Veronia nyctiphanis]|uniref:Uncharacterized protein n=1 Tax=Veronia nyctiphanis TaxID=1278244 RepID=A0A4Q0YU79_9GAMM|nr:hypothetical protein [Veronia nyctiphanis]RXJ73694.1 hypothetical protein CS022_08110 [Veronia nyctiphanis]
MKQQITCHEADEIMGGGKEFWDGLFTVLGAMVPFLNALGGFVGAVGGVAGPLGSVVGAFRPS